VKIKQGFKYKLYFYILKEVHKRSDETQGKEIYEKIFEEVFCKKS